MMYLDVILTRTLVCLWKGRTLPDALQRLITTLVTQYIYIRRMRTDHFIRHLFILTYLRQLELNLARRTK